MWRHNGFASNRAPYILVKKPGRKKGEPTHASKLIHNERFSGPASCSASYKTCDSMVLYLKRGSILIFSSKFRCQPKMEFLVDRHEKFCYDSKSTSSTKQLAVYLTSVVMISPYCYFLKCTGCPSSLVHNQPPADVNSLSQRAVSVTLQVQ